MKIAVHQNTTAAHLNPARLIRLSENLPDVDDVGVRSGALKIARLVC